jgi:hypothetical protein
LKKEPEKSSCELSLGKIEYRQSSFPHTVSRRIVNPLKNPKKTEMREKSTKKQ